MTHEDRLKAALSMIQVTPENYKKLSAEIIAEIIMDVYEWVARAEERILNESPYTGLTKDEIKERMGC